MVKNGGKKVVKIVTHGDESYTHPMIAMREAAEKQQEEEEALKKAMDMMEYSETEHWKKQARDN